MSKRIVQDPNVEKDVYKPFIAPLIILLVGLLMMVSILFVANLSLSSNQKTGNVSSVKKIIVDLDNDPFVGDKNAKLAIVEFSDYECPFCKAYYENTYSEVRNEYVDKGKALYVFRDSPLNIHNPLATTQALAAECIHELGGNEKYFQYHNLLFENTTSNGNGMQKSKLYDLASKVGVDAGKFKICLDSEKYKDEVSKDITDASKAGILGTPGFVIGKIKDGKVEGVLISGYQNFDFFKSVIDQLD